MVLHPRYVLERQQWVPLTLDDTFAFFAEPGNLPRITPPWLGFRILSPPPLLMAQGLVLDYRVRLLGWPVRWRSRIEEYDPPRGFRDVQLTGPYRVWDHVHRFSEERDGTVVRDRVVYAPPLGPLGAVLNAVMIRRQLDAIFAHRRERIAALLGGSQGSAGDRPARPYQPARGRGGP